MGISCESWKYCKNLQKDIKKPVENDRLFYVDISLFVFN